MTEERRTDGQTRERIDEVVDFVTAFAEANDARWRRTARMTTMVVLVGFVVLFLAIVSWRVQDSRDDRQNENIAELARAADRQADETAKLVRVIQLERIRNTRTSCLEINERNRRTKDRFDDQAHDPQVRVLVFSLIDALAPVRDCDAVVERRTGRSGGG